MRSHTLLCVLLPAPVPLNSGPPSSGWVTTPGVQLVAETRLTPEGSTTLTALNIGPDSDDVRLAAGMARVTYLSFPVAPLPGGKAYLDKLLKEHGHYSCVGGGGGSGALCDAGAHVHPLPSMLR
jgi:hypothetical protein